MFAIAVSTAHLSPARSPPTAKAKQQFLQTRYDSIGQPQDCNHQQHAHHQGVIDQTLLTQEKFDQTEYGGADYRADQSTDAAKDDPNDDFGRLPEAKQCRCNDFRPIGEQRAGKTGDRPPRR